MKEFKEYLISRQNNENFDKGTMLFKYGHLGYQDFKQSDTIEMIKAIKKFTEICNYPVTLIVCGRYCIYINCSDTDSNTSGDRIDVFTYVGDKKFKIGYVCNYLSHIFDEEKFKDGIII